MTKINQHMELLGKKAKDKVTEMEGVITCVSFDLYGCIQVVLTPKVKKDGTKVSGEWLDVNRLELIDKNPVLPLSDFNWGPVANGDKGPAEKPPGKY